MNTSIYNKSIDIKEKSINIKEIIANQIEQLADYNSKILKSEPEQYRKNLDTMCNALKVIIE